MKLPDAPELIDVCQACGKPHKFGLCADCQREYTDPATGKLQPWLAELVRDRDRDAKRQAANNQRVAKGITPRKREGQRGQGPSWGIQIVPLGDDSELEALRDTHPESDPGNAFPARRHTKKRAE